MAALFFVKVSGFLFKIVIGRLITKAGNGYFGSAYSIYLPIFTLALSGFPAAVSRLVASENSQGNYRNVRKTYRISLIFFFILGIVGTAFLLFGSGVLTSAIDNPKAKLAVICLAPTVFFCCIMSVYRGYYGGLSNLYPSAVSQIIEAFVKMLVGIGAAAVVMKIGTDEFLSKGTVFGTAFATQDEAMNALYPYGAAGAILGVTAGALVSCLYIFIRFRFKGDGITEEMLNSDRQIVFSDRRILGKILRIGLPISLGAAVMQLSSLIDSFTILAVLKNILPTCETLIRDTYQYASDSVALEDIPNILWGCFSYAVTFYNLVPLTVQSFSQSAIPEVTNAFVSGTKEDLAEKIRFTLKISLIFALPAGAGLIALSGPIIQLIYPSAVIETVPILRLLCFAAVFAALCQPINSVLQSIGKYDAPVFVMLGGAVIKLIANLVLVRNPKLNILGAAISTILCYTFLFFVLLLLLKKFSGIRLGILKMAIKPFVCALLCGGTAYGVYTLLIKLLGSRNLFIASSLIISVILAIIVYFGSSLLSGSITKNEIFLLPKGKKLGKVLEKLHILR